MAEAAEADVGQPRPAVVGVDAQGEMVERRPQPDGGGDAGGQQRHRVAEGGQQGRERPVELVAEPAPAAVDQLVDQRRLLEHDRFTQVDAEVLKRHAAQVVQLELGQRGRVGPGRTARADPVQVGVQPPVVHVAAPEWLMCHRTSSIVR